MHKNSKNFSNEDYGFEKTFQIGGTMNESSGIQL